MWALGPADVKAQLSSADHVIDALPWRWMYQWPALRTHVKVIKAS